jgi:hypothetical protein
LDEGCSSADYLLDSNFTLRIGQQRNGHQSQPFVFNWKLKADTRPSEGFDVKGRIQSDKHVTGVFMSPFDIQLNKEVTYSKPKGEQKFDIQSKSTVNSDGNLVRQTEVDINLKSQDEKWANGLVTLRGFTKDDKFNDGLKADLKYAVTGGGKGETQTQISNVTFSVLRNDLEGKQTPVMLLEGAVNKSAIIQSLSEFEFTESGHLLVNEPSRPEARRQWEWVQLVRMHNKEFTVFKQVEEIKASGEAVDLLHFNMSAKYAEENFQTKLTFKSQHSANEPSSNITITIAK